MTASVRVAKGGDDGRGAASGPRGGRGGEPSGRGAREADGSPGSAPAGVGPVVGAPARFGSPGRSVPRPAFWRSFERAGFGRGSAFRLDSVAVWARASLERDLEAGHGFHWLVVAFALGAALYLVLPAEPAAP